MRGSIVSTRASNAASLPSLMLIADIKRDMATKDQIIALHTQVNSIETQLRGMQHTKLQSRCR